MGFGEWLDGATEWWDQNTNPFHDMFGPSPYAQKQQQQTGQASTPGPATQMLEPVMSGMAWSWDNVISHPVTTLTLMSRKSAGSWSQLPDTFGQFFDPDQWKKSWNASQHISPGQAIMFDTGQGTDADQARILENAPLEYKRPAGLPQGFDQLPWQQQQDALKNAGMPVQGNAAVEAQRRGSAFFRYGSGALDFGLHALDPIVVGGKTLGAAKAGLITQPITSSTDLTKLMQSSLLAKTQQFVFSNRDNPQLLNNLSMARTSAMGPRFGAIASTLKSPDEVNLFLRTGMGDTTAMDQLALRNSDAAQLLEQDTSRLAAMDLMHSRFANNPGMQALVEREMDRLNTRISSNVDMQSRYNRILGSAHLIDQVNLTRWSFAQAEQQTALQNAYVAGAARKAGGALATGQAPLSVISRLPRQPGEAFAAPVENAASALRSPVADVLPGGGQLATSRIFSNSFFGTPFTMVRAFGEYRPNGHIGVQSIDQDSVRELRGYVARIPGIQAVDRGRIVNAYLATGSEGERVNLLEGIERQAMRAIADRHGLSTDEADTLFDEHKARQAGEKQALSGDPQYSTVKMPSGMRVDAFEDGQGGYKIHPNLVTRLINNHQMLDLNLYDRVLGRNSSAIGALRSLGGPPRDYLTGKLDSMNTLWKFSTLFRLGYIPRVLGDDLAGQLARLGAGQMALRMGWGIKNGATNMALSLARPALDANAMLEQEGIRFAQGELDQLSPQISTMESAHAGMLRANQRDAAVAMARVNRAQGMVAALDPADQSAKALATRNLLARHQGALAQAQLRMNMGLTPGQQISLDALRNRRDFLQQHIDDANGRIADIKDAQTKVIQGSQPVNILPDFAAPGAFAGQRGGMYLQQLSSEAALNMVLGSNKKLMHGNLVRSWDHGAVPVAAQADPAGHMAAWTHVINAQFGNDALARKALAGAGVDQMADWLTKTAEGISYRQRLGENLTSAEDLARRAHYDVNEIAPTPEIRAQALTPDGVSADQLAKQFPDVLTRPDVHRGQLIGGSGGAFRQASNKIMNTWYRWAAEIPADRLSRHPLFNQLYEGHAKNIAESETAQGRTLTTANDAERIAESARQLALRDTRRLVFDIAHQSDAGAALRFISPFFAATTEAWQRWGRIAAEKPEVVGYAGRFFNTPLSMGVAQDKDGNPIDAEGYAYDPVTKTRSLVPKGDRHIVMRVPKFLVQGRNPVGLAFGATPAGDINLSQDSMNLVLAGDPWFNPGQGPIVTIPLNEFVRDKPQAAEIAQHLGALPFGPTTNPTLVGRAAAQVLPRTVKDFLTSQDTTDTRYQGIKAQIMQRAAFEHATLGKPMPSAQDIADQTRNYWLFSMASAFLGPISGTGHDPYQFYRDEYNKMARTTAQQPKDRYGRTVGMSADDQFLEKYGESYFVFAQQMSKNASGAPATLKATQLEQKYADLIAKDPSLAGLIIGPEGNGPFSPGAYAYQLNTPLVPGGAEMQRTRLSADEAMTENQKRLGWAKYTARMNGLNAELVRRGLTSFRDPGAQDLKQQKQGFTDLYTKPLNPDGSTNPYFIQAFADDFNSQNTQKYNERIPALTDLARSSLANAPARSDLRVLQEYLGSRSQLEQELASRKSSGGSSSLTSRGNQDLANLWERRVQQLILADTSFGDLYHRYLSKDMQMDVVAKLEAEGAIGGSEPVTSAVA